MAVAYFFDSSALVKRYVEETGTSWVRGITRRRPSTVIYIARITAVEVSCAIARRRKGKTPTPRRASSILRHFRQHLAGRYNVAQITAALLDDATRLGVKHALRAYDAVQLAVALKAPAGLGTRRGARGRGWASDRPRARPETIEGVGTRKSTTNPPLPIDPGRIPTGPESFRPSPSACPRPPANPTWIPKAGCRTSITDLVPGSPIRGALPTDRPAPTI